MSKSYTLTVDIEPNSLVGLKSLGYTLCVAILVNNQYNVVWRGNWKYLTKNKFTFEDKYWVFGAGKFRDGGLTDALTNPVEIREGQTVTLRADGTWDSVTGSPKSGQPIDIINEYGPTAFGVSVFSCSDYDCAFSSEIPYDIGTVTLAPKPSLMVWFDRTMITGTMFSSAVKNCIMVDFTDGPKEQTINYIAPTDNPANGTWSSGEW